MSIKTQNKQRLNRARMLLSSQEQERSSKIQKLTQRHLNEEEQVRQTQTDLQEQTGLKREMNRIKSQQVKSFKKHLDRQGKIHKLSIMLKEQTKEEKLKKINVLHDKLQKTRNELNIKSLTYR